MTDEKELIFRRFPEDKQEQIRQLVAYTTLMGLSGTDLVSIGGKLNRIEEKNQALYTFPDGKPEQAKYTGMFGVNPAVDEFAKNNDYLVYKTDEFLATWWFIKK